MDDTAKDFCKRYQARVETSQYRVSKIKNTDITFSDRDAIVDPALDIEYEQMVAIHLPQAQARALVEHDEWINNRLKLHDARGKGIDIIIQQHEHECRVRNENPAVKAAYEKYLNLLNLVGSAYDYDS